MRLGYGSWIKHSLGAAGLFFVSISSSHAFFIQKNLLANDGKYCPANVAPLLKNGWGIAIRPAGFGGHFWISANGSGTSLEYIGDVGGVPLQQDSLAVVDIPGSNGNVGAPTGVVFNRSTGFVIAQAQQNGTITAPAKFLFATNDGKVTAWTERNRPDGGVDRPDDSVSVIDCSAQGSQFFGIGISNSRQRLYVADFGVAPAIRVYDVNFQDVSAQVHLQNPFIAGASVTPGDFVPFNVQVLGDDSAERVFVVYTKSQPDPDNAAGIFAGEEDSAAGHGKLVEYDLDGHLVAVWDDRGMLNSPWGLAIAPADFGRNDGRLLVSNFGDSTIVSFDQTTRKAVDYLRDAYQNPIEVEGIWGLQFGNGASLGEANHLYFAAGPADEENGIFGKLEPFTYRNPNALADLAAWRAQHEPCLKFLDGSWQVRTCNISCTDSQSVNNLPSNKKAIQ